MNEDDLIPSPVETQKASIDTLSVTVKALHVAAKQMTLAVFRQIPKTTMSDDCRPWGIVRYSIKDQGHIWLVVDRMEHLYRVALDPVVDSSVSSRLDWKRKEAAAARARSRESDRRATNESWRREQAEVDKKKAEEAEQEEREALENLEMEQRRAREDRALISSLPQLFIAL